MVVPCQRLEPYFLYEFQNNVFCWKTWNMSSSNFVFLKVKPRFSVSSLSSERLEVYGAGQSPAAEALAEGSGTHSARAEGGASRP
ncbi:hypothetical protein DC20_19835 [Rufibacter tibetensis]|uniref:Uncharacterized protein n=1 Tax=Rufibacter tibetensis TaxID=512763 RepID=A0A0N7HX20_9BACT|nr:hypothetical protein DC20_19835 [Rufibacter tibetensis]